MLSQCKSRKEFIKEWKRKYSLLESMIKEAEDNEQYSRVDRLGNRLANMEMNSEYLPCIKCGLKSCEVKSIYFEE